MRTNLTTKVQNNKVAKEQAEHKTGNGGIRFIKAGSVPEKVAVGDDVDVVAIVEGDKVNGRKGKRQRGRKYRSLDAETNDNPSPPTLEKKRLKQNCVLMCCMMTIRRFMQTCPF